MSYMNGGVIIGTVDPISRSFVPSATDAPQLGLPNEDKLYFGLPPKYWAIRIGRRAVGDHIAFSPTYDLDGIIYASQWPHVKASFDRGSTWRAIASVPFRLPRRTGEDIDYDL